MADTTSGSATSGSATSGSATSGGVTSGSAARNVVPTPPPVLRWLWLHTLARLGIAAVLVFLLTLTGIGFWAAALFGLLLSMPVAYVVLRPIRDRLAEGISARRVASAAAKAQLRDRLEGDEPD